MTPNESIKNSDLTNEFENKINDLETKISELTKNIEYIKSFTKLKYPDNPESRDLFLPYKDESNAYVISKKDSEHPKCENGLPVPPQNLWLYYGNNITEYLNEGKRNINKMLEILHSSDFAIKSGNRILDLGCGGGRMIRWLKSYAELCEIWGVDISSEHIYWCNQYLNPPFNFATTLVLPNLPFEDRYFDLIYCGSLFTHIDDLAESWFLELKRIVSKDGRIYVTIHDNSTIKIMNTQFKDFNFTKFFHTFPEYRENKDDFGMISLRRGMASRVIFDREYLVRKLSRIFDVISVTESAYGFQTAYLLKKK